LNLLQIGSNFVKIFINFKEEYISILINLDSYIKPIITNYINVEEDKFSLLIYQFQSF